MALPHSGSVASHKRTLHIAAATVNSRIAVGPAPAVSMDLKFALRSLHKNPGFTLLAVVVMALGIGANTAVFSVLNAGRPKPLAYRDPDRIVTLSTLWRKIGGHGQVSAAFPPQS